MSRSIYVRAGDRTIPVSCTTPNSRLRRTRACVDYDDPVNDAFHEITTNHRTRVAWKTLDPDNAMRPTEASRESAAGRRQNHPDPALMRMRKRRTRQSPDQRLNTTIPRLSKPRTDNDGKVRRRRTTASSPRREGEGRRRRTEARSIAGGLKRGPENPSPPGI